MEVPKLNKINDEYELVNLFTGEDVQYINRIIEILELNDIYFFTRDLSVVGPDFYLPGPTQIQIKKIDIEKVIGYLSEENLLIKPRKTGEKLGVDPCPKCNSKILTSNRSSIFFIIASIVFLGIPIFLRRRKWVCTKCNYTWREPLYFYKIFFLFFLLVFYVLIFQKYYPSINHYISSVLEEKYNKKLVDEFLKSE
ncbi:MAG: hypothetical protein V1874_04140 [Spirochaetota bacterium]